MLVPLTVDVTTDRITPDAVGAQLPRLLFGEGAKLAHGISTGDCTAENLETVVSRGVTQYPSPRFLDIHKFVGC